MMATARWRGSILVESDNTVTLEGKVYAVAALTHASPASEARQIAEHGEVES